MNNKLKQLIEDASSKHINETDYTSSQEYICGCSNENDKLFSWEASTACTVQAKESFKAGANLAIQILTTWTPVAHSLPENHPELLQTDIPDIECTVKVLVKTDTNSVIEASRIKYAVAPYTWHWHGGYSGEEIIQWRILY